MHLQNLQEQVLQAEKRQLLWAEIWNRTQKVPQELQKEHLALLVLLEKYTQPIGFFLEQWEKSKAQLTFLHN